MNREKTLGPNDKDKVSALHSEGGFIQRDPGSAENDDRSLRPQRMSEMVGQREVFERLEIAVQAARQREEPLGHILFDGPPGLGKTTFATCIPHELGVPIAMTSGAALRAPKDLIPYLTNIQDRAILFIDEIHRIPANVEEYLYTAMEDFRIDLVLGDGLNARTINMAIKPFTLIGATTRAGMLTGPLRDRFQMREHLDFYSVEELTQIIKGNAKILQMEIDDESANEIAIRSRSTPRIANNRLRCVRDYVTARAEGKIDPDITRAALLKWEIDTLGLDKMDRKYLETLIGVFHGGPAGVEAIAHTINTASDTLIDEVEPFLLRTAMVVRTPRGRVATQRAFDHMGMSGKPVDIDDESAEDDQDTLFT